MPQLCQDGALPIHFADTTAVFGVLAELAPDTVMAANKVSVFGGFTIVLLICGGQYGWLPIHKCCWRDDEEVVRAILELKGHSVLRERTSVCHESRFIVSYSTYFITEWLHSHALGVPGKQSQ
jgi:hypothetical protein